MEWSYDLLTDDERALLRFTSVFAGGFDLTSLCAVVDDTDEVDVLRQAQQKGRSDKRLEQRLGEVQGRMQCATGTGDGLKLLQRIVQQTKDDYYHHSWGGGAYYMEAWGIAALDAGNAEAAEEAFLESLAHDAGCFHAALGLQVLCEYQGRGEEAARYADLAQRAWRHADPWSPVAHRSSLPPHLRYSDYGVRLARDA